MVLLTMQLGSSFWRCNEGNSITGQNSPVSAATGCLATLHGLADCSDIGTTPPPTVCGNAPAWSDPFLAAIELGSLLGVASPIAAQQRRRLRRYEQFHG